MDRDSPPQWNNDRIGTRHARSMLNSQQAWSARYNRVGQWMTIDLGSAQYVSGVATQGRANSDQWVTSYTVRTSTDNAAWGPSTSCTGNSDRSTVVNCEITQVRARYVRIIVQGYRSHSAPLPARTKRASPQPLHATRMLPRAPLSHAPLRLSAVLSPTHHAAVSMRAGVLTATGGSGSNEVTIRGAREAPCGCPNRPIPGVSPVNPNCFVPADRNYDPVSRSPHEFKLSRSTWRADTGCAPRAVTRRHTGWTHRLDPTDHTHARVSTPSYTPPHIWWYLLPA
jgi:hypothetical protein